MKIYEIDASNAVYEVNGTMFRKTGPAFEHSMSLYVGDAESPPPGNLSPFPLHKDGHGVKIESSTGEFSPYSGSLEYPQGK